MPTLQITVRTQRSRADLVGSYRPDASNPREASIALHNYFRALAAGGENGSVRVSAGDSDPAVATATATVDFATLAATDTLVIAGVTLTCVASGATGVQFNKTTDATVTAANIAAAINALATLNIYVNATSALGVVTVRSIHTGVVNNLISVVRTGTGITLSAAALAGGTGTTEAPIVYSLGL